MVPKIIMDNAINLSYKTAVSILVISNHNSFRVPFDEIVFPYISFGKYIYIL